MRITAVVPMRHNSERVVGKNYRPLGGVPLFHHIVSTLLNVPEVTDVLIDTDSETIMKDAQSTYPSVRLLERPGHLRSGETPMNDVIANILTREHSDIYVQTHSTNPFLSSRTISGAISSFKSNDVCDSLFGVTRMQGRFWSEDGEPLNHDPQVLLRTQDLEPMYLENSCLYIFTRDSFSKRRNRVGERPALYSIPLQESFDIDNEDEFALATKILAGHEALAGHETP
jgi:CMP-N-acetylneuraminic acid synthetase